MFVARFINSPLNIMRTCGIVPLNVVASSPSSVPKAIVNCRSPDYHDKTMTARAEPAHAGVNRRPAQKRGADSRKILHAGVAIPE